MDVCVHTDHWAECNIYSNLAASKAFTVSHHVHKYALSCGMDGQGLVVQAFGFVQLAPELGQAAPLQQHRVRVGEERTGLRYAELGLL